MTRQVIGGKGGSGGASFVTKPDSLRSNDSFEILLGLGSGRWKGLVNGLSGLNINGVPLENTDGTSNFEDVAVVFADGNPLEDQIVEFKLGGGGASQTINTSLANKNYSGPGGWVVGAVDTRNADFIDLRFVVQQLFYQDTKSVRENTATIEVEMRPTNSSQWINIFSAPASSSVQYDQDGFDFLDAMDNRLSIYLSRSMFNPSGTGYRASSNPNLVITGKTSSAFVKELRVAVPKQGKYANVGWEVRARLLEKDTVDNGDIQERRVVAFESITAVIKEPLGVDPAWDGQVWMQIIGKASDQFNGFPEIEGVFDTKICQTPPTAVWNPDTRAYTGGTWAGNYEEHFTTDPAWQIKEFIEDPIHGVAGLQPGSTLDKWDALEASKYYSEQVPDGRGGTHPRFNMNLTLNEAQDVNDMLQFLAGSVNSYIEDVGDGKWRLKVDKPETPKILFTEDNVFSEFNYSHTDVDTRFNDWRGTFLNEDFNYEQDTVRVFDQNDIDDNGIKFTEIALIGCTNRQEALRRLMFRLQVSLNEYKIVSFTTNRIGRYINPLDTILVADGALNADHLVKSTSRFGATAASTVTLLRPVRLEVGINYTVSFTTEDKEVITRTVTNPAGARGDVSILTLDSSLPSNILAESAVALDAIGLPANPVSYRVISVERSEQDEDEYAISASIIDSGKWNAMDNVSEQEILDQEVDRTIDAPTVPVGGMFDVITYNTQYESKRVLQVNWDRPGGLYLEGFHVEYQLNGGPWILVSDNLRDSYFELQNPQDGTYRWKIIALDRRQVISVPLIEEFVLDATYSGNTSINREGAEEQFPTFRGSMYITNDGAKYRYEGPEITVNGNPLVINTNDVVGSGYVNVSDTDITSAAKTSYSVVSTGDITMVKEPSGIVKNLFPIIISIIPTLGERPITASATFSILSKPSGTECSIKQNGVLTVTGLSNIGDIVIRIVLIDGHIMYHRVKIQSEQKEEAKTEVGGVGSLQAIQTDWPNPSAITFTPAISITTVRSNASGEVSLLAYATYQGNSAVALKFKYRETGAPSWTDAAAEALGSQAIFSSGPTSRQYENLDYIAEELGSEGSVATGEIILTGLTADTDYEFLLDHRKTENVIVSYLSTYCRIKQP